jgi:hypothetical protein
VYIPSILETKRFVPIRYRAKITLLPQVLLELGHSIMLGITQPKDLEIREI